MPVFYCNKCLSLKILNEDKNDFYSCYCGDCGCVDISLSHVYQWIKKYKERYNKNY